MYMLAYVTKGQCDNPSFVSCNVSVVKIYSAASRLVRFENKIIFFFLEKSVIAVAANRGLYQIMKQDQEGRS
jgi:hypothetical protein